MKFGIFFAISLSLAGAAYAQTQVIADTMGSGKSSVFATANALTVKNFTTASFSGVQYWYGATDRVDIFGGATASTALGQAQFGAIAGANVNLVKSRVVSVSAFNTLSTPLHRRADSCDVLWFTALVASKNLQIGRFAFTPYSGYSVAVPLGNAEGKLFTPPEPVHNVPVGVMIPIGKFAFFAEYNFGHTQAIVGVGIAYTR